MSESLAERDVHPLVLPGSADVLVVDDNPSNLLAIEAALGDLGERLVKAESGGEALRHLLARDFALILLDVQMPTMDGFETARLIRSRERTRHLPIIFITAFDTANQEVLEAYELGAVDFLFKPIVPEILRAKASTFVRLEERKAEVARQAALLREHERREHQRRLAEERRRWEAEELRRRMNQERCANEELARRAEELARTVAERERAERELTRTNEALAEADRRKDEFLAVLAHELRNPLAPLVTGLELLRRRHSDDPETGEIHDSMSRQIRQVCRLVEDLLDVSRITAGKINLRKELLDLREVAREAAAVCRQQFEKRDQELRLVVCDDPVPVDGDAARLTQIACNLLSNASRYADGGARAFVSCRREGDEALLSVADEGWGIPAEQLGRIFEMFVQNRPGEGLGLGLTLVERLVALHGGRIEADSPGEGRGSTFTVRLPLAAEEEEEEAGEDRHNGAAGRHGGIETQPLRITLIEDNDDIRTMVGESLEMLGHRVHCAPDGVRGLELLLETRPDVALIDIGLPTLDGYEVAERVRAALPEGAPRLVAMTGHGQPADRARAERAGFAAYLVKPATLEEISRVLQES